LKATGAAVSGSFLFIIGLANSIILWRIIRQRRLVNINLPHYCRRLTNNEQAAERRTRRLADGENQVVDDEDEFNGGKHNNMLMMRILGPIIHFVDRPWKVGVLSLVCTRGGLTFDRCILLGYYLGSVSCIVHRTILWLMKFLKGSILPLPSPSLPFLP